jgi:Spy/CpxP family protein refolding chaperone
MNFLTKSRLLLWLLVVLVIINVTALASFFFFTRPEPAPACCPPGEAQCSALRDELKLSEEQTRLVTVINETYARSAGPVADEIGEARAAILNEMEQENPDTARVDSLINRIALLQIAIQKENIRQYHELRRVCDPEQAQKLSALYRELYGCPMQKNGSQHRYRHGQGAREGRCK